MALRKVTQEELGEMEVVTEIDIIGWEACDTVDKDGNDVPGIKVKLKDKRVVKGSLPLANGKPMKIEVEEMYVTGEDVAKFKEDIYVDDQTGRKVYRGRLKEDVSKPWFNNKGECTKASRGKLTTYYHADFKNSQQKQSADIRAKALAEMFGFSTEEATTTTGANANQNVGSLNLTTEGAPNK